MKRLTNTSYNFSKKSTNIQDEAYGRFVLCTTIKKFKGVRNFWCPTMLTSKAFSFTSTFEFNNMMMMMREMRASLHAD